MKLLTLTLDNFGPYYGQYCVNFPAESTRRVMVIYGDNMRGKTSFLNAIRWVLYGTAQDRMGRPMALLKLINLDSQKEGDFRTSVRLKFEADGLEYELARTAQPLDYIAQPKTDGHFLREVVLRKNGVPMRADEVEVAINAFIPQQVARFYLFDAELLQEYETLLIEDSSQGQKIKEAIEQVLGVPALVNARDECKQLLKEAQAIQVKELRHIEALTSYTIQSQTLQAQIESQEGDLRTLKSELNSFVDRLSEIDRSLGASASAHQLQNKLNDVLRHSRELKDDDAHLEIERTDCLKHAWKDLVQPRLELKRAELSEHLDGLQDAIKRRGAMEDRVRRLERVVQSSICPTCESAIDATRRVRLAEELGSLQADLKALGVNMVAAVEIGQDLTALNRIHGVNALATLERIEVKKQKNAIALTRLEVEDEELNEKLRGHDDAVVSKLQREKDGLLKLRGKAESQLEQTHREIAEKKRKVDQLAVQMSRNPEGRRQRGSVEVSVYSALDATFSKAINVLRDHLREKVASAASEVFRALTTEASYSGLTINANYGLTIVNRDGGMVPVRSAGAEQVVAMSLLGGLNQVVHRPGPLVIDTPFGRLDPRHRQNILRFIPHLAEQIILLVHEGEIARTGGLDVLSGQIGSVWEIQRISATRSALVKL